MGILNIFGNSNKNSKRNLVTSPAGVPALMPPPESEVEKGQEIIIPGESYAPGDNRMTSAALLFKGGKRRSRKAAKKSRKAAKKSRKAAKKSRKAAKKSRKAAKKSRKAAKKSRKAAKKSRKTSRRNRH
jgi:hypothetical protein